MTLEHLLFQYTVEPLSNDHPHQRPSLLYDQRLGQMEFTPSRMTTSRIPERLWNDCPIEGSTFYIEFQQAAVLTEHKKIAYRARARVVDDASR